MIQRRLEFLKAVRLGRYVLNELVWWASCEGLVSLGSICIVRQILENQICDPASAGFFKAARIGRYVFNGIDRWASYEGSHSLGRMLISSEILENQIRDPASAAISEGRQIWEVYFKRRCSLGFLRGPT